MTDLLERCASGEASHLIFVTGIPSKTHTQAVLDHFRGFGQVIMFRLQDNVKGNKVLQAHPSANIKRGFCILQAQNLLTYRKIISSTEPFLGRTLAIGPFRQGSALWSHNGQVNSRRVIVKKVPSSISQETLQQVLERAFGEIGRIYCFAAESTEKAVKKQKNRKCNTYSVEFLTEASAMQAAKDGFLCIPELSSLIVLEQYQKNLPSFGAAKSKEVQTRLLAISGRKSNQQRKDRSYNNKNNHLLTSGFGQSPFSYHDQPSHLTAGDYDYHNFRPTEKQYHVARETYSTDSSEEYSFNYEVRLSIKRVDRGLPKVRIPSSYPEGCGLHFIYNHTNSPFQFQYPF